MDRFDKEIKKKLNAELMDIKLSEEAMIRIHDQVRKERKLCLKDILSDFLNYEIKIPYSAFIAAAALVLVVGISTFTVTDNDVVGFINRNIIEITEYWEEGH
ncbi:MAG: hypothetical protein ACOX89_06595 [Lutispora sp.]|jgi:hypothetical protein